MSCEWFMFLKTILIETNKSCMMPFWRKWKLTKIFFPLLIVIAVLGRSIYHYFNGLHKSFMLMLRKEITRLWVLFDLSISRLTSSNIIYSSCMIQRNPYLLCFIRLFFSNQYNSNVRVRYISYLNFILIYTNLYFIKFNIHCIIVIILRLCPFVIVYRGDCDQIFTVFY